MARFWQNVGKLFVDATPKSDQKKSFWDNIAIFTSEQIRKSFSQLFFVLIFVEVENVFDDAQDIVSRVRVGRAEDSIDDFETSKLYRVGYFGIFENWSEKPRTLESGERVAQLSDELGTGVHESRDQEQHQVQRSLKNN